MNRQTNDIPPVEVLVQVILRGTVRKHSDLGPRDRLVRRLSSFGTVSDQEVH
jgi:hypothetical protein